MKKYYQITVLIIILSGISGQIKSQVADSIFHNRLYYTCKLWGHLKYYHTEIAKGLVNWDLSLLDAIDDIKAAPDNAAYNNVMLQLIALAGEMEISEAVLPSVPDSLNNNLDQDWIHDMIFTEPVQAALDTIRVRFRPRLNKYVGEAWAGGNPTFTTDKAYHLESDYPSEEKRILALFRYWNIINYFFPYKNLMDQDWDETLIEFIPRILNSSDALSYHLAFKELTTRINDSHAFFNSSTYFNWEGNYYPPFLSRYIENEIVITHVLPSVTGIKRGDVIKMIDGVDIYHLRDSLRPFINGSNDVIVNRNLNSNIAWGPQGDFSITVFDGTNEHSTTLTRNSTNFDELLIQNVPAWKDTILADGCTYGIVNMDKLLTHTVAPMFNSLKDAEAIVFDIRNYPNGTLWSLVEYLFPSSVHIANFTVPDIRYPGRLYFNEEHIGSGAGSITYAGKLIILFDERTQSQAEYTIMGLEQHPGAIKIGSTTAAADGNVTDIALPGKIVTYASFLGVFYNDYTPTQRVGIIPDIEAHPTIEGIRSGRDELMELALQCALTGVDHVKDQEDMQLFPNPTTDEIKIPLDIQDILTVEVIDFYGNIYNITQITNTISLRDLQPGLYIVKANDKSGKQYTGRVLKIE